MISVVTSVYNAERYIHKSIESVLSQTFEDFEYIIINDGSVDSTEQIVKTFQDRRIRFISHKVNRGSVPCLHEAIESAKYSFIATQDADDISLPDRLQMQLSFMQNNLNVFCVGGHAIKIDEHDQVIGEWSFPPEKHTAILHMLLRDKKCPIINPTSFLGKRIILKLADILQIHLL
jgi:glycosyltransferase involved in cell wall biosynthesis